MTSATKYFKTEYQPIKLKIVLKKLFDISILKGILASGFAVVSGFFAPIVLFVLGSFFLVYIDYVTGKKAAAKRGEAITSDAMRRSIDKMKIYMYFIIAAHVVDVLFIFDYINHHPLSYVAALAVARVEFFSIDENVNSFTGVSIAENVRTIFDFTKHLKK